MLTLSNEIKKVTHETLAKVLDKAGCPILEPYASFQMEQIASLGSGQGNRNSKVLKK
jgi:hypothetical protein